MSQEAIESWFTEVLKTLKEDHMDDVLNHPERIFNADESGFMMCHKSGKVLGPRKRGDFYKQVADNEKEQITVMGCFSADGKTVPPMIIYPFKRLPLADQIPTEFKCSVGPSDSGWINSEVFFEYIANAFVDHLDEQSIVRPVILFVDGHKSHLTPGVSDFCKENQIILLALLPNTKHILQPADVSVFKPLKNG